MLALRSMNVTRREFIEGAATAGAGFALSILFNQLSRVTAESVATTRQSTASSKRFVFVIDLDKCNGCLKCTEGCNTEMHVPPSWGQLDYEGAQPWIQVFDIGGGVFMPVPCQNCQNAPCVKVCPVGAAHYSEDHITLIDHDRCIGCRICIAACPYERRFLNWFDPPLTADEENTPYSMDTNIPHRKGVTEKCVWCRHRTKEGRVPACVEACTQAGMSALWFGDTNEDVVSNGQEAIQLSKLILRRGAYRLKEELGTHPSVLYLPPRGSATA